MSSTCRNVSMPQMSQSTYFWLVPWWRSQFVSSLRRMPWPSTFLVWLSTSMVFSCQLQLLVISGPVSLTRAGLDLNCKRLQKNWTAVPVHQRFESVAVPVHIFWQIFKNCKKPARTGFKPCTLQTLIALDYSSKTHQRSPKMVNGWDMVNTISDHCFVNTQQRYDDISIISSLIWVI